MAKKALPTTGDLIAADRFHVSKNNVRFGEPFGDCQEDQDLLRQIRMGKKLVQPFKARPEGDGYGVFVGKRRFQAKMEVGAEKFQVGKDVIIEENSDEDALDQSLIENFSFLRKSMNPVTRAKRIQEILASSPAGVRSLSRRWGIGASTISEWLKVLDLSEKMQDRLVEGRIMFKEALDVARMKLGSELQDKLAEILKTEGRDAFRQELARHADKRGRIGLPPGKFVVVRALFDRFFPEDVDDVKKLEQLAKEKNTQIDKVAKALLHEKLKDVEIKPAP